MNKKTSAKQAFGNAETTFPVRGAWGVLIETMGKRLYLSDSDKKIGGVCGGLAEYFGIDSTILRIIWFVLAFGYGTGIILYLAFWLIVPRENKFLR